MLRYELNYLLRLKLFRNRGSREGRSEVRPIKGMTFSDSKGRQLKVREYKHVEMPRVWYSLLFIHLSNITSLISKMDELIVSVRSIRAVIVAITEAWQIVPKMCVVKDFHLLYHPRSGV